MTNKKIYLSPPHMGGYEIEFVKEAFASNWIAPLGPMVDAFEREFAQTIGAEYALALSSGTAAIHLALILAGVSYGDEVIVSTLTFSASANPIVYLGARPVFIDSEKESWNIDPSLVCETIVKKVKKGKKPKAVVVVDLYGQPANIDPILNICEQYEIPVIEDAAEALGATYKGQSAGTFGLFGIFSFNGNKIITTSGGGMLVSKRKDLIDHARKLATQARDPAPHYEHSEIGYNYRMSNILAAIGRGQLKVLKDRVGKRRYIYEKYKELLSAVPGISFQPETPYGRSNRWLTCILIDEKEFGATREDVRLALDAEKIEARPVWKPMHMQPVFKECEVFGGNVAEEIFRNGLCLPSGSAMTDEEIELVVDVIKKAKKKRK
ncbi:MAG: aminotransferase class I/II-fold pyridoxal phosphate-dependent enzyme [Candidatus Aminicenantes bacterium]|nr:aminotransferase class I/II-fold pyridoxal phosphate-dependent enzyme [Candidatus Aminicenantes bacterium]